MKKLICLLLSIIMIVITFTGCTYYDDSTDESTEEYTYEETTEEETTETTTEPTTRQLDINFSAPNKMYVGNGMILKGVSQHTTIDDDNNITIELTVKCVSGFTDDGCPYFGYFLYYLYGKNNTLLDYTSIGTSDPLFKIPYSDVKDLEVGDETVITDTFSLSSFYCNADDIDKVQLNTPDSVRKYYNYYS